ncbi:hypothetical protein ElyMa_000938900 [Elysia marginata]|uniref:Uncharacterized protein n=1 Tax=Elysia marginata TaxID=1093978 RepID=A0AAV4HAC6_9GAST|nr:hypothetical protein ElyMa_000938900 [Elysia marginata]
MLSGFAGSRLKSSWTAELLVKRVDLIGNGDGIQAGIHQNILLLTDTQPFPEPYRPQHSEHMQDPELFANVCRHEACNTHCTIYLVRLT